MIRIQADALFQVPSSGAGAIGRNRVGRRDVGTCMWFVVSGEGAPARSTMLYSSCTTIGEHPIRGAKLRLHKPQYSKTIRLLFSLLFCSNGTSNLWPSNTTLWQMKCSWLRSFVAEKCGWFLWAECSISLWSPLPAKYPLRRNAQTTL